MPVLAPTQGGRKWKHRLTEIDTASMTAVCAECGPTRVWVRHRKGEHIGYQCSRGAKTQLRPKATWHRLSEIDEAQRTASCSICGPTKILRKSRYQGTWKCPRAWDEDSRRRSERKVRYGLTEDQYRQLWDSQQGLCALCETALVKPYVDHDHNTGVVRGLLCGHCNTGLGMFKDSPTALKRAIAYLEASTCQS